MLAAAGIQMPELEEFITRHQQAQAGVRQAADAAHPTFLAHGARNVGG
jgi:hypothetical protein